MRFVGLLLALFAMYPLFAASAESAAADSKVPEFRSDVLPILEAKCNSCHGTKKRDGKLDLRTLEAMLKGGVSGPAIQPGNVDKSLLIELIHFNEMPPRKDKNRVTAAELKLLKAWVEAGAPDRPKKP